MTKNDQKSFYQKNFIFKIIAQVTLKVMNNIDNDKTQKKKFLLIKLSKQISFYIKSIKVQLNYYLTVI